MWWLEATPRKSDMTTVKLLNNSTVGFMTVTLVRLFTGAKGLKDVVHVERKHKGTGREEVLISRQE